MKKDAILTPEELVKKLGNPNDHYHHKAIRTISDTWGGWNSTSRGANWWVFREAMRFVLNIYRPVMPYDQDFHDKFYQLWAQTLFHLSVEEPTMIAFTPNAEDGLRDRQVRAKMGKFLKKYQGRIHGFDDHIISEIANRFNTQAKPPALKFTDDPDEIARIYMTGPHSCMSESFRGLLDHPTKVYAKPPLALAYAEANGRVIARALVRHDTKEFVRPYGNEFAIQTLLQDQGYKFSVERGLGGLEIQWMAAAHGSDRHLLMPYLDMPTPHVEIDIKEKKILIAEPKTKKSPVGFQRYGAQGTAGYIAINGAHALPQDVDEDDDEGGVYCDHCEDRVDAEDLYSVPNVGDVCASCLEYGDEFRRVLLRPNGARQWRYRDEARWIESIGDFVLDDGVEAICERFDLAYVEGHDDFYLTADCIWSDVQSANLLRSEAIRVLYDAEDADWEHVGDAVEKDLIYYINNDGEFYAVSKEHDDELQEASQTPTGRIGTAVELFLAVGRSIDPVEELESWNPIWFSEYFHRRNRARTEENFPNLPSGHSYATFESFLGANWQAVIDASREAATRHEADAIVDDRPHHKARPGRAA